MPTLQFPLPAAPPSAYLCSVPSCDRQARFPSGQRTCVMHYQRIKSTGRPDRQCHTCGSWVLGPLRRYCDECGIPDWRTANPDGAKEHRRRERAAKYGMTVDEMDRLLAKQQCELCGALEPGTSKDWHIDHDPKSGRVRGLLCLRCNQCLGRVEEDVELLKRMIRWIDRSNRPE